LGFEFLLRLSHENKTSKKKLSKIIFMKFEI
jgi:hypothetical protein